MEKRITTVRGDISPEQLGFTSMHDHTFVDLHLAGAYMESMFAGLPSEMLAFTPENYAFLKNGSYLANKELQVVDDLELLVKEFSYFKAAGGQSVCDPGPIGLRGDMRKRKELSERTGLNIICATGLYHETSIPPELRGKDEAFYYTLFKSEIENGIDGTDVHPGILKASLATASENEAAVLGACLHLTKETGMATYIHTEPTLPGDAIVNLLEGLVEKYGVDRSRVSICHMDNRIAGGVMVMDYLNKPEVDRTLDLELQKTLLSKGYNIGLDTWGMPVENPQFFFPDDFERLKALITLIDLGYGGQITLGNDFSSKLAARTYGGYGCTRFIDFGLATMNQMGRGEQVHKLVYENPARILAY